MAETKPLLGTTVLVTRPRSQAEGLVRELERLGAKVHLLPVVEIGPPPDPEAVAQVLHDLVSFHWLVFTSSNGVHGFMEQLRQTGQDVGALKHLKVAAIGPQTAAALAPYGMCADLVPTDYRSEGLAAQLKPLVYGQRVLLARADRGRDVLQEELSEVAEVKQLAVYSQVDRTEIPLEIQQLLQSDQTLYVTLTSANIARQFVTLLPEEGKKRLGQNLHLVSNSPVTTAAVQERGFSVAAEAKEYTAAGVIAALVERVAKEKGTVT